MKKIEELAGEAGIKELLEYINGLIDKAEAEMLFPITRDKPYWEGVSNASQSIRSWVLERCGEEGVCDGQR